MPEPAVMDPETGNDWHAALDAEVNHLPEKYRIPVVLCELQGQSRKEVAHQLRIPEGTLSSRLATARKTLANRLRRNGTLLCSAALAGYFAEGSASASVSNALVRNTSHAAVQVAAGKAASAVVSGKVAAV
jgi:RNA polymerase sigma-70 factor (ECF subfamily)